MGERYEGGMNKVENMKLFFASTKSAKREQEEDEEEKIRKIL